MSRNPDPERFHALVTEHIEDPYPVYRAYREAANGLHRIERPGSGREPEWVVFRYDHAAALLSSRAIGRRADVAGFDAHIVPQRFAAVSACVDDWLIFMDPPRHTWVRAVMSDRFAARLRSGIPERIAEIVEELAAGLAGQRYIELVGDFGAAVPIAAILELLGIPADHRDYLRSQVARLQQGTSWRVGPPEERYATANAAAQELIDYFREALVRREQAPRDDLLSELAAADWGEQPAGQDLLVANCVHMLAAGQESTANAISKCALLLLRHPDLLDRLLADPGLVPAAVDEFIRFDSPAQMIHRWAYADIQLGEATIRRGEKATVVLGSVNRDQARFPDPDVVDIDRNASKHCGFGLGIHYCLGSPLARLTVQAGVRGLLKLLPDLRLASESVPYRKDLVFHGPERLELIREE